MASLAQERITSPLGAAVRFYRPELDVLRLLAFLSVFLTHGPRLNDSPVPWRHGLSIAYNAIANGGAYGLCLFFFLSSYLITELLLREKDQTGSIHLKWFYIRRLLRIWPLYYLAIACAVIVPFFLPGTALSHRQLLAFLLLTGYFAGVANGNPFGVLWSISVEELFYAVWPLLAKGGRGVILLACLLIVPLSLLIGVFQFALWYNPLAHFLFFATGALTALALQQMSWRPATAMRALSGLSALGCWTAVPLLYASLPRFLAHPICFLIADVGSIALFLAVFNAKLRPGLLSDSFLYLGRISYGLYVFHLFCFQAIERWLKVSGAGAGPLPLITLQILTLLLTISIASLSYRFWERPFLRVKDRYAPVRTRTV